MSQTLKQRCLLLAFIVTLSSIPVTSILASPDPAEPAGGSSETVSTPAVLPIARVAATTARSAGISASAASSPAATSYTAATANPSAGSNNTSAGAAAISGQTPIDTAQQKPPAEPAELGSVDLGGGRSMAIRDAALLPGADGSVVSFLVHVVNGSGQQMQITDYAVRLLNKSGGQYTVSLLPQDKNALQIPSGKTRDFHYYAKVDGGISLHDLQINLIQWDFSQPDFERGLGSFEVPEDYDGSTPMSGIRTISLTGPAVNGSIEKVILNKNDTYALPTIYFRLENLGNQNAAIGNYQFYILTRSGSMYPLRAAGVSSGTEISPQFQRVIPLTASLPANTDPEGWQLVVGVSDDSTKLTMPVGSFALPGKEAEWNSDSVPAGTPKTLDVDGNALDVAVIRKFANKNDKMIDNTIYLTLKNSAKSAIAVPPYQFELETEDGLTYSGTTSDLANLKIEPQASKDIQVKVSVPAEVSLDHSKLVLLSPVDSQDPNSLGVPLAAFDLQLTAPANAAVGKPVQFSDEHGVYDVIVDNIQRLPWQDQDILSAGLILSNTSDRSLPIPELTGKIVLDDNVEIPLETVIDNQQIGISRHGSIRLNLYGKIPYTYQYSKLALILQEKQEDGTINTLMEFDHDSSTLDPMYVNLGKSYTMEAGGKKVALAVNDVRTYAGIDGEEVAVLLGVQNLETRYANAPDLVAYYQDPDGGMYPATITRLKDPIGPKGVATLYVTGTLPTGTNPLNLKLWLGQAVGGTSASAAGGTASGQAAGGAQVSSGPVAYVNAVRFAVPSENTQPKNSFDNLQIYPFFLTMNNFKAEVVSSKQFKFSFDYKLSETMLASGTEEHKLYLEFADPKTGVVFDEELQLGADGENALKTGQYTKEFVLTDESILLKLPYLQDYLVRVYDEYNGMKKLLAEQTVSWQR